MRHLQHPLAFTGLLILCALVAAIIGFTVGLYIWAFLEMTAGLLFVIGQIK